MSAPKSIAVIGAGNVGTHLLALLARMPAIGSVTIVDHDFYEKRNIESQAITRADVGQPKAFVQAARLREINPGLRVNALVERVENVPWGALRGDALASCLDSRTARRAAGAVSWRLGIPFVDAGVQAEGLLARVHVYRPEATSACYECAWSAEDYAAEQDAFSCAGAPRGAAPTNAAASLGALAAAMQAVEIGKILADDWERVAVDRDVVIDANVHQHFVTRYARNPACRFDHRSFAIRACCGEPGSLTLGDLFSRGSGALRVEGHRFARQWACGACHASTEAFGLERRLAGSITCPNCRGEMRAVGFAMRASLAVSETPDAVLSLPISRLGFRAGDIFSTLVADGEAHFEITPEK